MTSKRWMASLLACGCLVAAGCDPGSSRVDVSGMTIPRPQLGDATATVRDQIAEKQDQLEALLAGASSSPGELADAFVELGLIYTAYEFLDAAEVCFGNAVALTPHNHEALHLHGHLLSMQGRTEDAEEQLSRALTAAPDDVATMVRLGTVMLSNGETESATMLLQDALERRPESAAALEGLAAIATGKGDHQAAIDLLEQALQQQPFANSLHYALSQAFRRAGDLERAQYHLDRRGDAAVLVDDPYISRVAQLARSAQFFITKAGHAMDDRRYESAAEDYRRALELEPDSLFAHRALAFCLQQLGDSEAAVQQLRQAIGSAPRPTALNANGTDELADVHAFLGQILTTTGDSAAAREQFRQALELRPGRTDIASLLADNLARGGRFDEAIGYYNAILEVDIENVGAMVKRATAKMNLGQTDAALQDFERAVALEPSNAAVRGVYADALEYVGRDSEAARQRAQAGTEGGGNAKAVALADQARSERRRGDLAAAAATYRSALAEDPQMTLVRFDYGGILGELGNLAEAAEQFAQVITEQPRHGGAHRGLITALLLQGDYGAAKLKFRDALQQLPRDVELAHALARLLATAPQADVRNGSLAVDLAGRVHDSNPSIATAATLAMALAEAHRWQEAVHVQREMVLGQSNDASSEGHALEAGRLEHYQQQRPVRLESPADIIALLRGRTE